jgi:hypothetical protein
MPTSQARRGRQGGANMEIYTNEGGDFTMQPETVLFASLSFIGIVVMLHIVNKFMGHAPIEEMTGEEGGL